MKRRDFLRAGVACGLGGAGAASCKSAKQGKELKPGGCSVLPDKIAGMGLEQLRDDYRDRLFNQYLPFWEKGGYDKQYGGFMCELNDDGSVQSDEKDIWYQGRGVWVYSFLYNNFGKDRRWLQMAKKTRDFMVKYMYAGNGRWTQSVHRDGSAMIAKTSQGSPDDTSGAMFASAGLIQYYKAVGNPEDLELAKTSILVSDKRYDEPNYNGKGLRTQGSSFVMVWPLTALLSFHKDSRLEKLIAKHVDNIMNKHWNPEYRITNEQLQHDFSRLPDEETHMIPGHSVEALWMVTFEALRTKNKPLFDRAKNRFHRYLQMSWDYIFGGLADDFYVFAGENHLEGPDFQIKSMWPLTEVLLGCMTILEYTGEHWAKQWYERAREFTLRTMTTDYGVWRQAVDRFGKDKKRPTISIYRKGNFHQPRYMMLNLLSLERMLKNNGKLTPFGL